MPDPAPIGGGSISGIDWTANLCAGPGAGQGALAQLCQCNLSINMTQLLNGWLDPCDEPWGGGGGGGGGGPPPGNGGGDTTIPPDCYWGGGGGGGSMRLMYPPPKGKGYHAVTDSLISNGPSVWRYPFIPGTLNTWCTQKCPVKETTPGGVCKQFVPPCPPNCDAICSDDFQIIEENLQYTGATGSVFLIDSTQSNNQVLINVKDIAGKNFNNMGTSPVRMISTNPYGSLYLLNHWRHGTTYDEFIGVSGNAIPNKIVSEYTWQSEQKPDYLQVAHGQSYGAIINSGGCIQIWGGIEGCTVSYSNYSSEFPESNIPWPSDIIFWEKSKQNDDGIGRLQYGILAGANTVLHPLTGDWTNRPFYISGNKSAAGTVAGMGTTSEGDIFATVWTNPKGYRSFGMNYFRVSEGFDEFGISIGTTWQANYQDVPKGVFGVRPDLLIWRAAHQIYGTYFLKGFTGCDGFSGQYPCRDRQWEGYAGWTGFECNEDRLSPSQVYFKQVSLGNQHGLVSLARLDNIIETLVEYPASGWNLLREQLNIGRREKIEWLFQFSGSTAANISAGSNWSTEGLTINPGGGIGTYSLSPLLLGGPISTISKLTYSKKDFVYEIGLTGDPPMPGGSPVEFRVSDVYNDICRWCGAPGDDEANPGDEPLIVNPYICNPGLSTGFTSCFRTEVTFGHSEHPIWNGGTEEMPNIFVLSAQNIAKLIEGTTEIIQNASWEWISAGSSGNSCAVLSYNKQNQTDTIQTKRRVLCWGPRYNKPLASIEDKHWPKNNLQLQPHDTTETIPCENIPLGVTWHPCQVDCSLESPIFYQKSWPFASYHTGNVQDTSPFPSQGKQLTTWSYNTLAKVLVWNGSGWTFNSNATIDEPMQTHYRNPDWDSDISKDLSKTIYFPNGLNQVQHRVFNNLQFPEGGEFEGWKGQNTYFLPLIPNFTSSQASNWGEVMFLPEWLNQWWFPNWTPNYPVVSGNSWLVNLYARNTSIDCNQCRFTGNTGCCELEGSQCFISERLDCESVGGTWTAGPGPCPSSCVTSCNGIDTEKLQLEFLASGETQLVYLNDASTVCFWTSEHDSDKWINVDPRQGTENLIQITVQPNDIVFRREAVVTITETENYSNTKTIRIIQFANDGGGGVTGACCQQSVCTITTEDDCGGSFEGTGTVCEPNPCGGGDSSGKDCCPYFTGPCCMNDDCKENKTPQECHDTFKGIFLGFNRTCDDCPS